MRRPYPPEFDQPCVCAVCHGDVDADQCTCPECPVCRVQGDPECIRLGHFTTTTNPNPGDTL